MLILRFLLFAALFAVFAFFVVDAVRSVLRLLLRFLASLLEAPDFGPHSSDRGRESQKTGDSWSGTAEEQEHAEQRTKAQKTKLDPFSVLEVSRNASREEISRAFKRKMSQNHPDKVAGMDKAFHELANERAKQITLAYKEALKHAPR